MKKHVLIGLALMLTCFIGGGVYIVLSIQDVTDKLGKAISFHEVEFLRQNLAHHIKTVQADLLLQGSPHATDFTSTIKHSEAMEKAADVCLGCHHTAATSRQLDEMEQSVDKYMKLLSRTLTIRANSERLENARVAAFNQGELLLQELERLSVASADKISTRIALIHGDINVTRNILIACLTLGPLAILVITLFFLKRYAGSIDTLLQATRTLERGDLDHRVDDTLRDEFRTLAHSFNNMAAALKNEQQKVRSIHELYQTLFESAGDAIIITALDKGAPRCVVSANGAAERLYGYEHNELIGMRITRLIPEQNLQGLHDQINAVLAGRWIQTRATARRKDGTLVPTDVSMGVLRAGGKTHLLAFCRDVSAQQQAEEALQQANQMKLVGQMAAGLAHEIKNPLAGVKVSLEVLAAELDLDPEDRNVFTRVIDEVKRMERLLKSLLNYARPPQPQFDLVDMNRLISNTLEHVEVTASGRADLAVRFEKEFAADLPPVEIDSAQLQQVLLNIFINSLEAMEDAGTISAKTCREGDKAIRIELADNGKGLSPASLQQVFNPFFTTKSKGTGLGLSICKRLVEQNGGSISVESREDPGGAAFTIILPRTQGNRERIHEQGADIPA